MTAIAVLPQKTRRRPAAAEQGALDAFLSDIVAIGSIVAPGLSAILGAPRATAVAGWTGDRRAGLELCANMLRYAREEALTDERRWKIDLGVEHLSAELDAIDAASGDLPN